MVKKLTMTITSDFEVEAKKIVEETKGCKVFGVEQSKSGYKMAIINPEKGQNNIKKFIEEHPLEKVLDIDIECEDTESSNALFTNTDEKIIRFVDEGVSTNNGIFNLRLHYPY